MPLLKNGRDSILGDNIIAAWKWRELVALWKKKKSKKYIENVGGIIYLWVNYMEEGRETNHQLTYKNKRTEALNADSGKDRWTKINVAFWTMHDFKQQQQQQQLIFSGMSFFLKGKIL